MSHPTYNERVSPARRRRSGDPTLDAAAEAASTATGTAFIDLADAPASVPGRTGLDARCPGRDEGPGRPATRRRSGRQGRGAGGPRGADRPRAQPGAGARRHDDRGPAADPGRGRLGQDPRPGPPDRLPGRHQGRRARGGSWRSPSPTGPRPSCASGSSASSARAGATSWRAPSTRSAARVLRADGEAIGIGRRFVIYDTDDQQSLMKQILREEDMPLTGEFRPSAVLGAISRAKNEMLDPTFLSEHAANHRERTIARLATRYQERLRNVERARLRRPAARGGPPVRRGAGRARQVPGALALPPRRRVPGHEPRAIPVGPARWRPATATCASSATTTSRSTRGAARTCATSSTSSATGRTPRSSSSSRTTARPS